MKSWSPWIVLAGCLTGSAIAAENPKCYLLFADCAVDRLEDCSRKHPSDREQRAICVADCNLCEKGEVCIAGDCCPLAQACVSLEKCCPTGWRCSLDGECVRPAAAREPPD